MPLKLQIHISKSVIISNLRNYLCFHILTLPPVFKYLKSNPFNHPTCDVLFNNYLQFIDDDL